MTTPTRPNNSQAQHSSSVYNNSTHNRLNCFVRSSCCSAIGCVMSHPGFFPHEKNPLSPSFEWGRKRKIGNFSLPTQFKTGWQSSWGGVGGGFGDLFKGPG